MTHGLPEEDGAHVPDGRGPTCSSCASGPARSCSAPASAAARARSSGRARSHGARRSPLLIDADGLNAHAGRLESLRERPAPTVLTPHEGELGRLLGIESEQVQAHGLACAREAAARSGCVVVLKGDDTIVAAPEGTAAVSPGATPALATAGTGDVLSGLDRRAAREGHGAVRGGGGRSARARSRGRGGGAHGSARTT